MNTSIYATNYPLFTGMGVTQGHANYCEDHGHASYVVDGVDQGICPRCMESTEIALTVTPAAAPRTPRYVQVNIGRNIGTEPMDYREWAGFKLAVEEAILAATAGHPDMVQVNEGMGAWVNGDNTAIVEESAHLSVFADVDTFALRKTLATLKATYEQDAIALIVGSDLI